MFELKSRLRWCLCGRESHGAHMTPPRKIENYISNMIVKLSYKMEMLEEFNGFDHNQWNKETVEVLLDYICGRHGQEGFHKAMVIIQQFMEWYEYQKDSYLPERDFEVMYSKSCLKNVIDLCKTKNGVMTPEDMQLLCNLLDQDEQQLAKTHTFQDNLRDNGIFLPQEEPNPYEHLRPYMT